MNITEEDFDWLLSELYPTHYNHDKYNEIRERFLEQHKKGNEINL